MRRWLILGLLVGCGRLGFDLPTTDASGDGAGDGNTIDAACLTDSSYTQFGPMRFKAYAATDWVAAEQQCEADGAHLAVFDTIQELGYGDGFTTGDAWIGVTDRITEGTMIAVTSQPTFTLFPAAPATSDTDDCMRFEEVNDVTRSRPCSEVITPLCECDDRAAVTGTY